MDLRKKAEFTIAIILLLGIVAASVTLSRTVASWMQLRQQEPGGQAGREVIVVDAGHGGRDPGKVGINDVYEKDLNLEIALQLRDRLEDEGFEVVMIREEDKGLYSEGSPNKKAEDMRNRVAIINETAPIMTISIHQNSYDDPSVRGAQVFYYSNSDEGERVANILQESIRRVDEGNRRESKANDTYYLLKKSTGAAVIIECGFLSSPIDAAKLANQAYQEQLVEAIGDGIVKWASTRK